MIDIFTSITRLYTRSSNSHSHFKCICCC